MNIPRQLSVYTDDSDKVLYDKVLACLKNEDNPNKVISSYLNAMVRSCKPIDQFKINIILLQAKTDYLIDIIQEQSNNDKRKSKNYK